MTIHAWKVAEFDAFQISRKQPTDAWEYFSWLPLFGLFQPEYKNSVVAAYQQCSFWPFDMYVFVYAIQRHVLKSTLSFFFVPELS